MRKKLLVILIAILGLPWLALAQETDSKQLLPPDTIVSQPDSIAMRIKALDATVARLRSDSVAFSKRIENLEKVRQKNDTLVIRVAESRIVRRYNEARIQDDLNEIDRTLSDSSLLDYFSDLMYLLKHYKQYNEEIKAVLNEIQKDPELAKSVRAKGFVPSAIEKIRKTEYCQKFFDKDWTKDWTIFYLNEKIKQAIARLEAADRELQPTSLTDIIEAL